MLNYGYFYDLVFILLLMQYFFMRSRAWLVCPIPLNMCVASDPSLEDAHCCIEKNYILDAKINDHFSLAVPHPEMQWRHISFREARI